MEKEKFCSTSSKSQVEKMKIKKLQKHEINNEVKMYEPNDLDVADDELAK